jgi:hypothetical protein
MEIQVSNPMAPTVLANEPIGTIKKKTKTTWVSWDVYVRQQRLNEPKTSDEVLEQFDPQVRAYRPDPKEFYRGYKGKITCGFKYSQYVYIQDVRNRILFSQTTISDFNKGKRCDYPLDYLADSMFIEYKKDIEAWGDGVLDIVDNGDGTFTSVDNRRLLLAKKFGAVDRTYGIWIKVHAANEELSKSLSKRFLGAKTWGEAVAIRVNNNKVAGYLEYPTIMSGSKAKESQSIPVSIADCDLSALDSRDVVHLKRQQVNGCVYL